MKTFHEAIYEWVAENYGQSEADDPSWNIEALADHLSKTDIKPDELNAYTKSNCNSIFHETYACKLECICKEWNFTHNSRRNE